MLERLVRPFIFIFGLLTIATQLSVAIGLTFNEYYPLALVVLLIGVMTTPFLFRETNQEKQTIQHASIEIGFKCEWVLALILLMITLLWVITKIYLAFWLLALVALVISPKYCKMSTGLSCKVESEPEDIKSKILVLVIAAIAATITSFAHRPDTDDGFFISVASHALSHPNIALLSVDTMHEDPQVALPLLLPAYAVESLGLIEAVFAKLLGIAPIAVAHLLLPPLFAMLVVVAWVLLVNEFLPNRLVSAALLTLVILILFGEHHQTIGNFGFVRLHQGKAVLASAIVPLLYFYVIRYMNTGSFHDLTLVCLAVISGIGLSSSGVFVMPAVMLIGALSSWTSGRGKQLILLALPLGYIGVVALYLRAKVLETDAISSFTANSTSEIISSVFGQHTQYIVLFCLVGAWLLVPNKSARRSLYFLAVFSLLGPMNPFISDIIAKYITSPSVYWRILWPVPALLCCTIVMIIVLELCTSTRAKWRIAGAALALGFILLTVPFNVLRQTNNVAIDLPRLKANPEHYAVALEAIRMAPAGTAILAPQAITIWIAAQPSHPFIPINRHIDLPYLKKYLSDIDFVMRGQLSDLIQGGLQSPALLSAAIEKYSIGLIIISPLFDARYSSVLKEGGFIRAETSGFSIWRKEALPPADNPNGKLKPYS